MRGQITTEAPRHGEKYRCSGKRGARYRYRTLNWATKTSAPSKISAGPPQMQSADFQPRDLAIARSLRQEIKKAGLFSPFMSTTLGWRSNSCAGPAAADVVAEPLGEAEDMTA